MDFLIPRLEGWVYISDFTFRVEIWIFRARKRRRRKRKKKRKYPVEKVIGGNKMEPRVLLVEEHLDTSGLSF